MYHVLSVTIHLISYDYFCAFIIIDKNRAHSCMQATLIDVQAFSSVCIHPEIMYMRAIVRPLHIRLSRYNRVLRFASVTTLWASLHESVAVAMLLWECDDQLFVTASWILGNLSHSSHPILLFINHSMCFTTYRCFTWRKIRFLDIEYGNFSASMFLTSVMSLYLQQFLSLFFVFSQR